MAMNNLKLGVKIGAGFGLSILLTLILGGLAFYSMGQVKTDSLRLNEQYVPEVSIANQMERDLSAAMLDFRGYGFTGQQAFLDNGRRYMQGVAQQLVKARDLSKKYPQLAKLKAGIDKAASLTKQYNELVDQTKAADDRIDAAREKLYEAAQTFNQSVRAFIKGQSEFQESEFLSSSDPRKLAERARKIAMANEIMELGDEVRVMNFKAQALRQIDVARKGMANFTKMNELFEKLGAVTREEMNKTQLNTAKTATEAYQEAMNVLMENWFLVDKLNKERTRVATEGLAVVQGFASAALKHTQEISDGAVASLGMANMVLLAGLAVAVIIGVLLAIFITRAVTRPIRATMKALGVASNNDLTYRLEEVHLKRGDEMGEMARDLQKMVESLADTVREVTLGVNTVANSANEISQGNQDLSERTQQQASAIEETASAIEEMTSSVKQNAHNSQEANELARRTAQMAQEGGDVLQRTVTAMEAVTDSSKKIADIINVVNEIAFQTNLLALNAAVEAARAGEAGRGFAVVAGEVRNLAGRSASAAKEIQALISDSVSKVEQGNEMVAESGRLLGEIITNVQAVADTISEINAASQEQATGITEVNKAVAQMDDAVQQNAALVEEAASAAENMAAAAEQMRTQMQQFKVDAGGGARRPAALPKPPSRPQPARSQAAPRTTSIKNGGGGARPAPPKDAPKKQAKKKDDDFFDVDELEGFEEF